MSGRLSVTCDGLLLHTVGPNEFVNAVEWRSLKLETNESAYQVIGRLLKNGPAYQVTKRILHPTQRRNRLSFNFPQVTMEALTPCQILIISNRDLMTEFEQSPNLKVMLQCVVGKDVAKKLYSTIDNASALPKHSNGLSRKNILGNMISFKRTASEDAIRTGAKGFVRSRGWVEATNNKELFRDTGEPFIHS